MIGIIVEAPIADNIITPIAEFTQNLVCAAIHHLHQ